MRFGNWTIKKCPRGFEIELNLSDGVWVRSNPIVRDQYRPAWIFYPYILFASISAVRKHAREHTGAISYPTFRS